MPHTAAKRLEWKGLKTFIILFLKESDTTTLIGVASATGFLLQYGEAEATVNAMTVRVFILKDTRKKAVP